MRPWVKPFRSALIVLLAFGLFCGLFGGGVGGVSSGMADEQVLPRVDVILQTGDQTTIIDAEIADTAKTRAMGLMYREDLTKGQGMLFIFASEAPRLFWMKNTPLSLDILFFDQNGHFVNGHYQTVPFSRKSLRSDKPAQYALEILGGEVERLGLTADTILKLPLNR